MRVLKIIRQICDRTANALYPPRCPFCDAFVGAHDFICEACLPRILRLEADAQFSHLAKIWFARCRSIFAYEDPVKNAIHGLKYSERFDLVRYFGSELSSEAQKIGEFDVIMPVPLHPARLRERGFNQSALLARRLGKILQKPCDVDSLKRTKNIVPQVGLERKARLANIKGAFEILPKAQRLKPNAKSEGKSVLLIDDVVTTGATANECARVLLKAGAETVSVLSIARAL